MTIGRDAQLYNQAKTATESLMRHYRKGAYRVIRDSEGVFSLWAIEGNANDPFSISFVERGRVYNKIEDIPHETLKSYAEYVQKMFR